MQHERSVALPSIHEMFPEHLLKETRHTRSSGAHRGHSASSEHMEVASLGPPLLLSMRHHTTPHAVAQLPASPSSVSGHDRPSCSRQHIQRDSGPRSHSSVSFDILRSDPSSSSLQHIASSATFLNRGGTSTPQPPRGEVFGGSVFRVPVSDQEAIMMCGIGHVRPPRSSFITSERKSEHTNATLPYSGYSAGIISFTAGSPVNSQSLRGRSPDDPDTVSDGDLSSSHNGKKHVCSTCSKRFNRPSSLRIHVNTHTGATPFRCPWPNCAREFNVNSNMRRHYRNHTAPAAPRPQAVESRRRRKRGSPNNVVFVTGDSRPKTHHPSIVSSQSMELDSDVSDDEEDELESSPDDVLPAYMSSKQPWERTNSYHEKDTYDSRPLSSRYSQSHVRSDQTGNSFSSSPSPIGIYSPSEPYSRSFADSRVSTALRPAFHTKPASAPIPPISI
ncbi:Zinc finger protein [Termitomyces sp. T112]|nr:Zinc finger protein [Termitomyces sp. T112]